MGQEERDIAEVAALADGSLPAERRPDVERRVAASPELTASLERQRRAIKAVHAGAAQAPAGLRARIERPPSPPRRRPRAIALGLAGVAAAVLLALLLLPGPEAPSVAEAAALAARPPTAAAPERLPAVEGVRFPHWEQRFDWRAAGVRSDRLGGRRATTVYYRYDGHQIGYTIVGGGALGSRSGFHSLRIGGRAVVTWRRRGHTCVLSGRVHRRTLLRLASY
jgi:anti-sigma factor RsiW